MAKRPTSHSKKPKRKQAGVDPRKALQPAEVLQLQAWARQTLARAAAEARPDLAARNAAIVLVLLGTGARRFELCALRCGDFYQSPGGPMVHFDEAKGAKDATTVVSDDTYALVTTWLVYKGRVLTERTLPNEPLFCGRPGEHMSVATLHNIWKTTLAAAGLPEHYGVHASRHAAGLLLLRATNSLSQVAEFLRHSSERITERFYKHVLGTDIRAGLKKAGI
jgi:integrase